MEGVFSPFGFELPGEELPSRRRVFYLWGIDGELIGNEARMHACLPLFTYAGDSRVFAVRRADWSFDPPEGLAILNSEKEAASVGTKLNLNREVSIDSGQIVVLLGPQLYENLLSFANADIREWLTQKLHRAQENFYVVCLEVSNFEALARRFSDIAKKFFDKEVKDLLGLKITPRAEAALSVLRNTGYTPLSDQIIRTLVAERIQERTDAYRKTLKLAALRLKRAPSDLEQDANKHIEILALPAKQPTLPPKPAAALVGEPVRLRGKRALSKVQGGEYQVRNSLKTTQTQRSSDKYRKTRGNRQA